MHLVACTRRTAIFHELANMQMLTRLMSKHGKFQVLGQLWSRHVIDWIMGLIVFVWLRVIAHTLTRHRLNWMNQSMDSLIKLSNCLVKVSALMCWSSLWDNILIKKKLQTVRNRTEHPTQLGTPRPPASVADAYPATAPLLVVQCIVISLEWSVKVWRRDICSRQ